MWLCTHLKIDYIFQEIFKGLWVCLSFIQYCVHLTWYKYMAHTNIDKFLIYMYYPNVDKQYLYKFCTKLHTHVYNH